MQILAGFGLKGIKPRVCNPTSLYYLKDLQAVIVSYANFYKMPSQRRKAMEKGLHEHLQVTKSTKLYLDHGAFSLKKNQEVPVKEYTDFVKKAKPDWYPITQDFIPIFKMNLAEK